MSTFGTRWTESLEARRLLSAYYFNSTGNDKTGNGSSQHPWATLAKADTLLLRPGDRILLAGGRTFIGHLTLGASDAGTNGNPVVVESCGPGVATIYSPTGVGILVDDCGDVTIANLKLIGPGRDAATADGIEFLNDRPAGTILSGININHIDASGFTNGIELDALPNSGAGKNGYNNVSITQCLLHDDAVNGIVTKGKFSPTSTKYSFTNVLIEGDIAYSIFHHADGVPTEDGIQLADVNGATIQYCVAHDNGLSGNGEVGIWVWDSNNAVIEDSVSYRNHTGGNLDGDGFDLDGGDTNCILQDNYSYNNDGAGFPLFEFAYARPFHGDIIRDNTSINDARKNGYGAIDIWSASAAQGISDCEIYGNTIVVSPAAGSVPSAIRFRSPTTNIRVFDNSFTTAGGMPLVNILTSQDQLVFQANHYQSSGGAFVILDNGVTYRSLAKWDTATGD